MEIIPIKWSEGKLKIINQTLLPDRLVYKELHTVKDVADAIKKMEVRGAPAIGIAVAYGLAISVFNFKGNSHLALRKEFEKAAELLKSTRPTAVNLIWAIKRMEEEFNSLCDRDIKVIKKSMLKTANNILREDIENNRKIGKEGLKIFKKKSSILTHCNAGALATGGYGTALGVIRTGYKMGLVEKVYVDETRPKLQGAKLTTWELQKEGIPYILISDNSAGFIINRGKVDLIIVGADRIAENGDTANKIGTYMLAVCAKENNVPFYVAAPLSTIDMNIKSGEDIIIEIRKDEEVLAIGGKRICPKGTVALNYAFDITPSKYISGLITEKGLLKNPIRTGLKKIFQVMRASSHATIK